MDPVLGGEEEPNVNGDACCCCCWLDVIPVVVVPAVGVSDSRS